MMVVSEPDLLCPHAPVPETQAGIFRTKRTDDAIIGIWQTGRKRLPEAE